MATTTKTDKGMRVDGGLGKGATPRRGRRLPSASQPLWSLMRDFCDPALDEFDGGADEEFALLREFGLADVSVLGA